MTDMDVNEAERVTARIRKWVKDFPVEDVQHAYEGRVWIALGYDSWAEWCDCELDGFKLPAPQRKKVVASLAGTGMSNRAIAEVVGANEITVRRDGSTATNVAVDRATLGQDGKTRKQPKRKPAPEVDIEDAAIEIDGTVIEPDQFIEMARDAQESLQAEQKADHTGRYLEIQKEGSYILRKLRAVMDIADGVDFTDEERDLTADLLNKMKASIGLIEMRITGELDVDWDAEFQKIL